MNKHATCSKHSLTFLIWSIYLPTFQQLPFPTTFSLSSGSVLSSLVCPCPWYIWFRVYLHWTSESFQISLPFCLLPVLLWPHLCLSWERCLVQRHGASTMHQEGNAFTQVTSFSSLALALDNISGITILQNWRGGEPTPLLSFVLERTAHRSWETERTWLVPWQV